MDEGEAMAADGNTHTQGATRSTQAARSSSWYNQAQARNGGPWKVASTLTDWNHRAMGISGITNPDTAKGEAWSRATLSLEAYPSSVYLAISQVS